MSRNKIVIFSHGFGVRKDCLGMFTDIADVLSNTFGINSIMFDYNEYKEEIRELLAISFSEQAKKLQKVIDDTIVKFPDHEIVIIGQSQGFLIPCLCDLKNVTSLIGISPFFYTDKENSIKRYLKLSEDSTFDVNGISIRKRSDGSTTIIPAEYRKERFATDIISEYNKLASSKKCFIIYGLQDQVMNFTQFGDLKNINIATINGDHDFSKGYRPKLLEKIKEFVTKIIEPELP